MTESASRLLATEARHIHNRQPIITFPTTGGDSWKVWSRYLAIRGESVFEIGNICGTCEYWFRRLDPKALPIDISEIDGRLSEGVTCISDRAVGAFEQLLDSGTYRIALIQITPTLVQPGTADDYFTHELTSMWQQNDDEEPNDPATPYYRIVGDHSERVNDEGDLGFEFIASLQNPNSLDSCRIEYYRDLIGSGGKPTAVAVGILDIKQHYNSEIAHWCLTHYLIDGHHKIAAAALVGQPITLLTFIASDRGVSKPDQVDHLVKMYA